jgi:hypothetical protein
MTTRYEIRDLTGEYTLTVADATADLPAEVLGWLEAGEAQLWAVEPTGAERLVVG